MGKRQEKTLDRRTCINHKRAQEEMPNPVPGTRGSTRHQEGRKCCRMREAWAPCAAGGGGESLPPVTQPVGSCPREMKSPRPPPPPHHKPCTRPFTAQTGSEPPGPQQGTDLWSTHTLHPSAPKKTQVRTRTTGAGGLSRMALGGTRQSQKVMCCVTSFI